MRARNLRQRQGWAAVPVLALSLLYGDGGQAGLVRSASPAPSSTQEPQGEAGIKVSVNLTLVEATVKDKRGQVLGDLAKDDFRVFEDGIEQKITHFSRDQIPLAVALVLDLSGSIEPFLGPLRYASLSSLKALKKEDRVALFTFTDTVERRVSLTRDKTAVSDEFESLRAGGGTNINDAVYEAARYLADQAPAARRVIILVSDNKATDSGHASPSEITRAVLEADASVYSTKIPGQNPAGLNFMVKGGLVNVEKLTAETGGELFDVKVEGSMYVTLRKVIERLKTRYTLGYVPPTPGDGQFHKLDVRVHTAAGSGASGSASAAKSSAFTIVSKKGYYGTRQRTATN